MVDGFLRLAASKLAVCEPRSLHGVVAPALGPDPYVSVVCPLGRGLMYRACCIFPRWLGGVGPAKLRSWGLLLRDVPPSRATKQAKREVVVDAAAWRQDPPSKPTRPKPSTDSPGRRGSAQSRMRPVSVAGPPRIGHGCQPTCLPAAEVSSLVLHPVLRRFVDCHPVDGAGLPLFCLARFIAIVALFRLTTRSVVSRAFFSDPRHLEKTRWPVGKGPSSLSDEQRPEPNRTFR